MPRKPAKYGTKTWVASNAQSSNAWKMQEYTGKLTGGGPGKKQGTRVVLDVTDGLRGHNVTCENVFTSYELRQQLLKRKITMVGTVRKNKPELPLHSLQQGGERPSHQSCLHPHPSFLPPREEQECGPPEHTAQNS
jgi:hypothetical protein